MSVLDAPHFRDDEEARKLLERIRWPDGPVCAHCGTIGRVYATKKPGVYRCAEAGCRKDFTVITGTAMGSSHIPLHKWMIGFYLMNSSKKGVSSKQLERTLGITYRAAWFMSHRIREAMRDGGLAPMGGGNGIHGIVEADETFIGTEPGMKKHRGYAHKMKVLSLVDRETGQVRSMVVDDLKAETLVPILTENIAKEASVMTDDAGQYRKLEDSFIEHQTVAHSQEEYVRGIVHTNTVEGYFSVFKRGMKGVYQHCGKQHLHRYLAEFDFRYNHRERLGYNDVERTKVAIKGISGRRLTYRQPDPQRAS